MVAIKEPMAVPTASDASIARESSEALSPLIPKLQGVAKFKITLPRRGVTSIRLPKAAVKLLAEVLSQMAKGNAVTLIPSNADLTTQQAAEILNVSRPFVVKLIDDGTIPSYSVGKHRRVRYQDILAYKEQSRDRRRKAMTMLTEESQELGIGY